MNTEFQHVKEIFLAALERDQAVQRSGYLEAVCGQDVGLRERVEALLVRHDAAGSFLESLASELVPSQDESSLDRPGAIIGPYKLLQKIGEGGMGTVFMAEQSTPVQRMIALKLIKPGMDSSRVIARFEAERQALALMDHPNIAKVFDGGTTPSGRPFFVMELVKGVLITRYCDEHLLTPRQRLELFIPICQAVQHAHHKGIIHRDLKPSNVMLCLYDGIPMAKIIDFGVAKATGSKLTEHTLFTEFGQVIGTFEYMSPEQAELSQRDIDTRSDIYSLGVLLYELMTGTTPLERKRLKEVAYLEVLRLIREEEPPKPSTRLSTAEGLRAIAANRSLEPKKLSGLVRGELDWIVMKCLDKDRSRRYETATGLAADLRRYLADEPVQACPPSVLYRFRKFTRRNKGTLVAAVLLAALLVTAVVVLLVANYQIREQRNVAEREYRRAEANLSKARAAVDDYLTTVSESTLLKSNVPGLQPLRKELLLTALGYYQGFMRDHEDDPELRIELAAATFRVGVITAEIESQEKGLQYLVEARDLFQRIAGGYPIPSECSAELGRCLIRIGYLQAALGKTQDAKASYRQGIDILEAILPSQGNDLLRSELAFGLHYLGLREVEMGMHDEGSRDSRRAIELRQELVDGNPLQPRYRLDLALSINNLSFAEFQAGRSLDALQTSRNAEAIERELARESPWNASMRRALSISVRGQAAILHTLGRKEESLACYQDSVEIIDKVATENPLDIDLRRLAARSFAEYAQVLVDEEHLEPAKIALAKAQEHAEIVQKANPKNVYNLSALSSVHRNRGKILGKQSKPAEALRELRAAVAIDQGIASEGALHRYDLACSLAVCSALADNLGSKTDVARYAEQAMVELRSAWTQGWNVLKVIESDPDLDALRSRSDFKEFMKSIHGKSDLPSR
jgi:serine/threonine protein kinase/tetratricopeptide (TPR) repeat protein